jgi:hypothetical protein
MRDADIRYSYCVRFGTSLKILVAELVIIVGKISVYVSPTKTGNLREQITVIAPVEDVNVS